MADRGQPRLRLPMVLPPLTGKAAPAFLIGWLLLLAIFIVGTIGEVSERLHRGSGDAYTWAPLGLRIELDSEKQLRVAGLTRAASAAGLRAGDRILALSGFNISPGSEGADRDAEITKRLLVTEGQPIALSVRSGGGGVRNITLRHRAADAVTVMAPSGLTPQTLTYASVSTFLLASFVLLLSSALLFRRRKEPVAALFSLGMIALASTIGNQGAFWGRHDLAWLMTACTLLGSSALYTAIIVFPTGRFQPRWTSALALSFPALQLATIALPIAGWLMLFWLLSAIIAMVIRYRRQAPDERRQWKWAMLGFAAGIVFLAITLPAYSVYLDANVDDFATSLWSWIITPLLVAMGMAIIVGGLVLSVLRYRLYDTPAAISRSLVYAVLTATLVAIFAGSEKILEIAGEEYFGEGAKMLAGGLAAAFAAATIAPLHHRFSHWAEHLLRKDLLHLRTDLPPLLFELSDTSDESDVAEVLLEHLEQGLHAKQAAILSGQRVIALRGAELEIVQRWVASRDGSDAYSVIDKNDPLFPVRVPLTKRGSRWLLVGRRPDGSLYGKDERELFSQLAAPLGQALSAANRNAAHSAKIEAIANEVRLLRQK